MINHMKESNTMTLKEKRFKQWDEYLGVNVSDEPVTALDENDEPRIHRSEQQVIDDEKELMEELDKLSKCCKAKLYNRAEAYHSPVNVCTICENITDEYGNPIITGDRDTDELLEDERIAQEDQAIDQIINNKRGK